MNIRYTVPEIWHLTDVIVFFLFWVIFCPFTSLTARKIKTFKKGKKKHLEISSFYNNVPKIMIICYAVPEILHVTDVIVFFFHFELFFALLPPKQPEKSKFKKKAKKTPGDIIILQQCTKNHDHMLYCSGDMPRDRCNYFSFGPFFPFLPPYQSEKSKLKKNKKRLEISSFYICVRFLRYGARQTDRQTDGKGTYRWVSHVKIH